MKKLDLSAVTDSAQFFPKQGTFNFLQLAYQEGFSGVIESLIGATYNPALVYIITGCNVTQNGGSYTYTSGVAYYGGEFFKIIGGTITPSEGQVALFVSQNQSYTINADPVIFADHTAHSIHISRSFAIVAWTSGGAGATGYIADVSTAIRTVDVTALNLSVVKLSEAQTIAGVKTFSNSPIIPTPTTDMQASTKKYVDDKLSNAILYAGSQSLGDISNTNTFIGFSNIGTSDYYVVGTMIGLRPDAHDQDSVAWNAYGRTATGFYINTRELNSGDVQNLVFEYMLFKK